MDIAARVSNGEEGVFNNHLVGNVLEMDLHVLEVGHWFIEVVVDDICGDAAVPFAGIGDDGIKVDLEVQLDDRWGAGVSVVSKFVSSDCEANAMCFSF